MKRIGEWDFFKGFLILMVILGHVSNGLGKFEADVLMYARSFTVSFIMPAFLFTTGYFIYHDSTENIKINYLVKKARRLLLPAIIWGGSAGILTIIISSYTDKRIKALNMFIILARNIKNLWYLYATFISSFLIWSVERVKTGKNQKSVMLILILIMLHFIPTDIWYLAFSFSFILLGYFFKRLFIVESDLRHNNIYCIIIVVIYLYLLKYYSFDLSIYVAGTNLLTNRPLLNQIGVDSFRFMIGIFGTISIFWILSMIYRKFKRTKIIVLMEHIGICSLEMYVTQYILVEKYLQR